MEKGTNPKQTEFSHDILFEAYQTEEEVLSAITDSAEHAFLARINADDSSPLVERVAVLEVVAKEKFSTSNFKIQQAILGGLTSENKPIYLENMITADLLSKKEFEDLKEEFSLK